MCISVIKVTADGGLISFSDPNKQEEQLSQLLYCEVVCGLLLLAKEGTFIVKIFTTFEPQTISLLYLLACCFEEVRLIYPIFTPSCSILSGLSEHHIFNLNLTPGKKL